MAVSEIIVSYISANRDKGKKDAIIVSELKKAGWGQDYIDSAFKIVDKQKIGAASPLTYTTAILAAVLLIGGGVIYAVQNRSSVLITASVEEAATTPIATAMRDITGKVADAYGSTLLSASSAVDGPVSVDLNTDFSIKVAADQPDTVFIYDIINGVRLFAAVAIPGNDTLTFDSKSTAIAAIFATYDQTAIDSNGAGVLVDKISASECLSGVISRFDKNLARISYDQIMTDVLVQGQVTDCAHQALNQ
jgi:hypothetical protein